MKRRPWNLIFIAFLHLVMPMFALFVAAESFGLSFGHYLSALMKNYQILIVCVTWVIPAVLAVSIFAMKRWSYYVYLSGITLNLLLNIILVYYTQIQIFSVINWILIGQGVIVVTYLLAPDVRRIYFDPTIRWWESKPRYQVMIPAKFHGSSAVDCMIENISQGGAFVSLPLSQKNVVTDEGRLSFSVCSLTYNYTIKVLRRSENNGNLNLAGQMVFANPDEKERLYKLISGIRDMGCESRSPSGPWWHDLLPWT